MAISAKCSPDGKVKTIRISGVFDFKNHREFREAYEQDVEAVSSFVIDMREAEYIDSSALGMLLILRKFAAARTASVCITNCSEQVRPTLEVANFHKLFEMS